MFWSTRSGLLKLCHPNFLFLIIKFVPLALPVTLEMTFPTPKMEFLFSRTTRNYLFNDGFEEATTVPVKEAQ